jgi:hypothetical protein
MKGPAVFFEKDTGFCNFCRYVILVCQGAVNVGHDHFFNQTGHPPSFEKNSFNEISPEDSCMTFGMVRIQTGVSTWKRETGMHLF